MRVVALSAARVMLLAGPTALGFFSGGYFDEPRAWAGLAAWLVVATGVVAAPGALPRNRATWLTLASLVMLAGWTLLSTTWAPIAGSAYHAGELVVLYLGVVLAAVILLRPHAVRRAVEPALAAGAVVVIGYGLSERLLPGVLHFAHSLSAQGRLEQPLTYWNAMGELAGLGFVLSVRLAGDATRPVRTRSVSAAAAAPLGMGLYLSFSRGALFACAAGLVALIVLAPWREQLRAAVLCVAAGGLGALAAAPQRAVTALAGSLTTRGREGALTLVLLAALTLAAGVAQWLLARRERSAPLPLPRRAPLIALAVICVGLAVAIVVGAKERSSRPLGAGASRYVSLQSNRYAYWRVAIRAFGDEPLRGVGAGGWSVYWLRYRPISEFAQDAHSLPLQTLAELGVVGLALLSAFLAGIVIAARTAHRVAPALSAGPIAGFVVWAAHAPLDWDWQMPAVTLVAMALAGVLLATGEESYRSSAIRGASRVNSQTANAQIAK